jgi:hypothetical protein
MRPAPISWYSFRTCQPAHIDNCQFRRVQIRSIARMLAAPVDHPRLVGDYRDADRIRAEAEGGAGSTEEMRLAMQNYKAIFDAVLSPDAHPKES